MSFEMSFKTGEFALGGRPGVGFAEVGEGSVASVLSPGPTNSHPTGEVPGRRRFLCVLTIKLLLSL